MSRIAIVPWSNLVGGAGTSHHSIASEFKEEEESVRLSRRLMLVAIVRDSDPANRVDLPGSSSQ